MIFCKYLPWASILICNCFWTWNINEANARLYHYQKCFTHRTTILWNSTVFILLSHKSWVWDKLEANFYSSSSLFKLM
jgi:hypothetical protein